MKVDKRLVVMITDSKGTKYINVNMIFKQVAFYIIVFVITFNIFAFVSVNAINQEIKDINKKNQYITEQFESMQNQNNALNDEIAHKQEEIVLVGEKIDDLENVVGVNKDEEDANSLANRINIASVTALQKSFVMKFIPNGLPLKNYNRVSAPFGKRLHPILHIWHVHTGLDLATPTGTEVYATADGVADWANSGHNGGYGKLVKISHSFGFRTYYAHLDKIIVSKGEFIKKGQLIAYSGNTGYSTGPHLHYEVRFLGQPINPMSFIKWNMSDFDFIFNSERKIAWQSLLAIINSLMEKKAVELQ